MSYQVHSRTGQILQVMKIVALLAFIGFSIQAGAIIISYIVSCVNPEAAKNLYKGLNMYQLSQYNFSYYTLQVSFTVLVLMLKSYVCYYLVKTLSGLTLSTPFTIEVAQTLEKISYLLLAASIVGLMGNIYAAWLLKKTGEQFGGGITEEFLFMAGLVFVIAQIFKRGVEIQTENDLTV